ncbi:peptide deformylase [Hyphococcus luteus]|uniref:Peptide deformylase n=1 Tax=Hyphococcus luteus TaxID=2058213 RepID=A0A2S7K6M7_9PROT|nr:peptide deformylase [Marinicaulis flavus]PQA88126.1 peptide deformylase [Marinicaulis flavus]
MSIRPILTAPDARLRQVSKPVETVDGELRALMDDMLETMYDAPGIGLAAIQVGVPLRVIVMDLAGKDEEPEPRYFVNPEILDPSEDMNVYEEGCLSVPEYFDEVERPARCRVKYLDYDGNEQILEAEGLLATCIQHEMDHLEGVLFIDHLSRLKRERVLKKLKKEQRLAAAS